jgi:hypothetical protein
MIAMDQTKAQHRKYKRLKLGGGQAHDRSSDGAAVTAYSNLSKGIICCERPGLADTLCVLYIGLDLFYL